MASTSYKSKLEELCEALKKVKKGITFSMTAGTWKRVVDAGEYIVSLFDMDKSLTQR